jgi:hypothetical protein
MAKTKANVRNMKKGNQEIARVKQMVKSMISQPVEHKYFDQSLALGAVVNGNIYNISDITRGDQVTQRIGNQVTLKKIDFRASFSININVDKAMIRYLLLVDKQGYNAPSVTDVLQSGLVGTTYTDICPYEWDYRRRFKVLHDEVVAMNKNGSNGYTFRQLSIKLNLESTYIGASTTFTNQIYLIVIGSETNILDISNFQYHSRIEFTDD